MKKLAKIITASLFLMAPLISFAKSDISLIHYPVRIIINNQSSEELICTVDKSHNPKYVHNEPIGKKISNHLFIYDFSIKTLRPVTSAEFHCYAADESEPNKPGNFVKIKYRYKSGTEYCKVEDSDNFNSNYKLKLGQLNAYEIDEEHADSPERIYQCIVPISDNE